MSSWSTRSSLPMPSRASSVKSKIPAPGIRSTLSVPAGKSVKTAAPSTVKPMKSGTPSPLPAQSAPIPAPAPTRLGSISGPSRSRSARSGVKPPSIKSGVSKIAPPPSAASTSIFRTRPIRACTPPSPACYPHPPSSPSPSSQPITPSCASNVSSSSPDPSECPKCLYPLSVPPSIPSLIQEWGTHLITPNVSLDRSLLRCKQCDMRRAQLSIHDPRIMWPTGKKQVNELAASLKSSRLALEKTLAAREEVLYALGEFASASGDDESTVLGRDVDIDIEGEEEADARALARQLDLEAQALSEEVETAERLMQMAEGNVKMGGRAAWVPFWAVWGPLPNQEELFVGDKGDKIVRRMRARTVGTKAGEKEKDWDGLIPFVCGAKDE